MSELDDFLKSLQELKESLTNLQANTDELLRHAPKEEVKKTFRDKSLEELEVALGYYTRHENFEICLAIREVMDEKTGSAELPAEK